MNLANRVIHLMFTVKPHSIRLHQWEVYEYFASQIHQLEESSDDEPLAYIKMVMQVRKKLAVLEITCT